MKITYTVAEFQASTDLSAAIVKDFSRETYEKIMSIHPSQINELMKDQGFSYDSATETITFEVPEEQFIGVCKIAERYAGPIGNIANGIFGMVKTLKYMFKDMEDQINKLMAKPVVKAEIDPEVKAPAAE